MIGRVVFWGLLMAVSLDIFAQTQPDDSLTIVTGQVVTDTSNNPVPYAHLALINAKRAATTDGSGSFRLRLPLSDTLEVTAVGFVPVHVPLYNAGQQTLLIRLEPDTLSLPTHTVIGYTKWQDFKRDFENMDTQGKDTADIVIPGARQYRGKRHTPPATVLNPASMIYENFSPQALRNKKLQRTRKRLQKTPPEGIDLKNLPILEPRDTLRVDTLRLPQ